VRCWWHLGVGEGGRAVVYVVGHQIPERGADGGRGEGVLVALGDGGRGGGGGSGVCVG
jgi:hypothetical protein